MGDYYHQFLSSMSGIGGIPGTSPHDVHPPPFPGAHLPVPPSPQNYGYFSGYPEPMMYNPNPPKSQKSRKRGTGFDHVKHRRTRSGCFTCRSRRVKCDEARPICDRCRKGNRDCIYPDPPPEKGAASQSSTSKDAPATIQQPSPISSNEGEDREEVERTVKLETIPDEDEEGCQTSLQSSYAGPSRASSSGTPSAHPPPGQSTQGARRMSEASSQDESKGSPAASTETSSSLTPSSSRVSPDHPSLLAKSQVDWSKFSPDVQRYMTYFLQDMTHLHYGITHDGHDFFHSIFPNFVARNEALLNAVVGFSAYHYNLEHNPNGKIQEFLQYYNRSVTLLLRSLKHRERPDISTLLTVLQLASIEEFLGDWINLMGHQKAAFEILIKLFTPSSAAQSPLGRMVVQWYARFDVWVATQGSFPTTLSQEWLTEMIDFCQAQLPGIEGDPAAEYAWKMERELVQFLVISRAMSMLFARRSRGQIAPEDYAAEHERLLKVLAGWRAGWGPVIVDPAHRITEFNHGPPVGDGDIVDPHAPPQGLYRPPKFATTGLVMHFLSISIMHKLQSPPGGGQALWMELAGHGYEVCQIFEQIERFPQAPRGSILFLHAPLSISGLITPQDQKHHMWFRRKFALLESKGFIYPSNIRVKLGELFRDPSCEDWWLPNGEGQTPLLRAIRNLADERNAVAIDAQQENLREVHHVFAKLDIGT